MAVASVSHGERLSDLRGLALQEMIDRVERGLPAACVWELAEKLEINLEQIARLLRLTPRTLQRRFEAGQLEMIESERVWELVRIFFRAVEVLESESGAVQWFKSPIQALGWKTPLALAQTAVGLRELEKVLGRIEHGVFS